MSGDWYKDGFTESIYDDGDSFSWYDEVSCTDYIPPDEPKERMSYCERKISPQVFAKQKLIKNFAMRRM